MEYKIARRDGCEVFVAQDGTISIVQDTMGCDGNTINLHPEEALALAEILQKIYHDAIDYRKNELDQQ